ncbi:MAG: hypothetical protein AABX50_02105 [Nanoarchaeota archaeon]
MTRETPLYDAIGKYLVGKRLRGCMKRGESEQEYTVLGYTPFGDAEDLVLNIRTIDGREHKISLIEHLSDIFDINGEGFSAQSSPKLRPTSFSRPDPIRGINDLIREE